MELHIVIIIANHYFIQAKFFKLLTRYYKIYINVQTPN